MARSSMFSNSGWHLIGLVGKVTTGRTGEMDNGHMIGWPRGELRTQLVDGFGRNAWSVLHRMDKGLHPFRQQGKIE